MKQKNPLAMNPLAIARHLVCIVRKLRAHKPVDFHVRGILREFGIGRNAPV